MPPTLLEMSKEMVCAMIDVGGLQFDEVLPQLQSLHAVMMEMQRAETSREVMTSHQAAEAIAPSNASVIDWKKSITKHSVACLECGATFKQLSARHLSTHDLSPQTYRIKYGIPRTQPLSAREVTTRRRQLAKEIRPWEKVPPRRGRKR